MSTIHLLEILRYNNVTVRIIMECDINCTWVTLILNSFYKMRTKVTHAYVIVNNNLDYKITAVRTIIECTADCT